MGKVYVEHVLLPRTLIHLHPFDTHRSFDPQLQDPGDGLGLGVVGLGAGVGEGLVEEHDPRLGLPLHAQPVRSLQTLFDIILEQDTVGLAVWVWVGANVGLRVGAAVGTRDFVGAAVGLFVGALVSQDPRHTEISAYPGLVPMLIVIAVMTKF